MKDLYWDTSPVAREDREQLRAENKRLREERDAAVLILASETGRPADEIRDLLRRTVGLQQPLGDTEHE